MFLFRTIVIFSCSVPLLPHLPYSENKKATHRKQNFSYVYGVIGFVFTTHGFGFSDRVHVNCLQVFFFFVLRMSVMLRLPALLHPDDEKSCSWIVTVKIAHPKYSHSFCNYVSIFANIFFIAVSLPFRWSVDRLKNLIIFLSTPVLSLFHVLIKYVPFVFSYTQRRKWKCNFFSGNFP